MILKEILMLSYTIEQINSAFVGVSARIHLQYLLRLPLKKGGSISSRPNIFLSVTSLETKNRSVTKILHHVT